MKVVLKQGREKSLKGQHPWIFSGAVSKLPNFTDGDILAVTSCDGEHLGYGYFNKRSQIIGRMLCFDSRDPIQALQEHLAQAVRLRESLVATSRTNARRLVNAEGDFLPGLIVDAYADVLVIQISTLGMEKLKAVICDTLRNLLAPTWIYEASTSPSRKQEGLKECRGNVFGEAREEIEVYEDGLKFYVRPQKGQKTGFFQDLRELRLLVQALSQGKRVLNCFSYTGAFSCHALKGGAAFTRSVDISQDAIDQVARHMQLNGIRSDMHAESCADCFDFLRNEKLDYDLIILDPPAFAKRQSDVPQALRGYQEINRTSMSKMKKDSLLLTCSCSYHVDEALFRKMLFTSAKMASRQVRILHSHRLAMDHPINLYHPEGSYLKSYLCHIS